MRKYPLVLLLFSALVFAENKKEASQPLFRASHPASLTVNETDTISSVARVFLLNPWRWPEAWGASTPPAYIYPGDTIWVDYKSNAPQLKYRPYSDNNGSRTTRLGPRIKIQSDHFEDQPRKQALLFSQYQSLVYKGFIFSDLEKTDSYPKVIGAGNEQPFVLGGSVIYAKGNGVSGKGRLFNIYRPMKHYSIESKILGINAHQVGVARVVHESEGFYKLIIMTAKREIRKGDILVPASSPEPDRILKLRRGSTESTIIALLDPYESSGQYDNVIIRGGTRQGVMPGNTFAIYPGNVENNISYTNEKNGTHSDAIGRLVVYQSFENLSYALVLGSSVPVTEGGILRPMTLKRD